MQQLNNAFTIFLGLLVEALPFLLLGVLFSGLLLLFVDERRLVAWLPKQPILGALCGSLVGFLFPVCECGNVPVARRLLLQGAPAPVAIGFLLAAPTINPIVIWSTWTAFQDQPEIVVLRVGFTLVIATVVGWLFSLQPDLRPLLKPSMARLIPTPTPPTEPTQLQSGTYWLGEASTLRMDASRLQASLAGATSSRKPWSVRLQLFLENTVQELRELGAVLVLGALVAALLQTFVPRDWILSLGQGPVSSILAMLLLATVVSICSTVDAFFALSFSATFTSGSLLAFLVFGPMIDLKSVGLMLSMFHPRLIIYMVVLAAQLTFLFTLVLNLHVN